MKAIILIKMNTGDLRDAFRDLNRLRSVAEAHLTFGPYDAIAIVHTDDLKTLGRIVAHEIHLVPGVVETCTCLMVDSDVLENVQVAVYPVEEGQPDTPDDPIKRNLISPFGKN